LKQIGGRDGRSSLLALLLALFALSKF